MNKRKKWIRGECLFSAVLAVVSTAGEGCGHTTLSSTSGTVASRNYPGTYPNHTQCVWSLKVRTGHTLHLTFGDFDLEWSKDCKAGFLTISDRSKAISLGREFVFSETYTMHQSKIQHKTRSRAWSILKWAPQVTLLQGFPCMLESLWCLLL